jgi:hypothetical protein
MWREPFIYRIPSLFSYEDETGSPILEPPDVGIAVNAVNMDYDGETLQLRLLLTYTFAQAFVRAFARIFWAMVVVIENADTGQCEAFNLSELGRKTYPLTPAENFSKTAAVVETPTSFKTGWLGLDLELDVPRPAFHPSLFISVKLHDVVSNTIAVDLEKVTPVFYKGGEPVDLECADLSDEA